jgi:hypothetical protein
LALLATEANEIMVRELAMETREGMETGGGLFKFGRAAPAWHGSI